jgi:F1F0 ATPase subunit 2
MNSTAGLSLALCGGVVLGALYFGGLWLTIRCGLLSRTPGLCFLGSLLLRTGAAVGGFLWIAGGDWQRLIASLVGFVGARLFIIPRASLRSTP